MTFRALDKVIEPQSTVLNNISTQVLSTERHTLEVLPRHTLAQTRAKPGCIIVGIGHRTSAVGVVGCASVPTTDVAKQCRTRRRANDAVLHPGRLFLQRRNRCIRAMSTRNLTDGTIFHREIDHQKIYTDERWWQVSRRRLPERIDKSQFVAI